MSNVESLSPPPYSEVISPQGTDSESFQRPPDSGNREFLPTLDIRIISNDNRDHDSSTGHGHLSNINNGTEREHEYTQEHQHEQGGHEHETKHQQTTRTSPASSPLSVLNSLSSSSGLSSNEQGSRHVSRPEPAHDNNNRQQHIIRQQPSPHPIQSYHDRNLSRSSTISTQTNPNNINNINNNNNNYEASGNCDRCLGWTDETASIKWVDNSIDMIEDESRSCFYLCRLPCGVASVIVSVICFLFEFGIRMLFKLLKKLFCCRS